MHDLYGVVTIIGISFSYKIVKNPLTLDLFSFILHSFHAVHNAVHNLYGVIGISFLHKIIEDPFFLHPLVVTASHDNTTIFSSYFTTSIHHK